MSNVITHNVADLSLASEGRKKILWAGEHMPVLQRLREKYRETRPLEGIRIAACLHVTPETANLMIALKEAGAEVRLSASNPLSTKDDVAASLVADFGIPVFARHGESREEYYENLRSVLMIHPHITLDDGGDLTVLAHTDGKAYADEILGGTEETTTGVIRFRAMEKAGTLQYPIVAVNDSLTKHLFDNRYGTGQSTIDGILRATNLLLAGSVVVVCGYGWCGRGVAMRARGMGARVIVTEVDPVRALEAVMDGFAVMPLEEAAREGDFFVTVTGNKHVLDRPAFENLKHGAVLANAGHFNVEINLEALEAMAVRVERNVRPFVDAYHLRDGRVVYVLAEGRLVNLVAAEGHPPTVMDMSFANQFMAALYLVERGKTLEPRVYTLPREIDEAVAREKLASMGVSIDTLTEEQRRYLESWEEGT